jgi:hypothetical protein
MKAFRSLLARIELLHVWMGGSVAIVAFGLCVSASTGDWSYVLWNLSGWSVGRAAGLWLVERKAFRRGEES